MSHSTASSTSVPSPPGLHFLSSIRSDVVVAFRQSGHVHVCGVFHARDTTTRLPPRHMWLKDVRLWPAAVRKYTVHTGRLQQFPIHRVFIPRSLGNPSSSFSRVSTPKWSIFRCSPRLRVSACGLRVTVPLLRSTNTQLTPATAPLKSPNKKTPSQWLKLEMEAARR